MLAVGLSASWACADEVEVKFGKRYIPYSGVRITDVIDGQVRFMLSSSRSLTKKLSDIRMIGIEELPSFGEAERLVVKGKDWARAVRGYDTAARKATKRWQKMLIAIRRLRALNEALMVDRAVKEWLSLADATDGAVWVLAARPTKQAKRGYPANAAAIAMLEGKRASGKRSKQYDVSIADVLIGLYTRQGLKKKASALAEWVRAGGTVPPNGGNAGNGGNGTMSSNGGSLASVEALLEDGKAKIALNCIEKDLRTYTRPQLPGALLMRGRAQVLLAKDAGGQAGGNLLLQAGLNFMRVVVADAKSPEAPEALFEAGRIHTMLPRPNLRAARAAYRKVIANYPKSAAAAKARRALGALQ